MVYMTVEEHNLNLLHLKRSPGIRSWSLLVGKPWHMFWLFYIHTYNVPRRICITVSSAGIASVGLAAAYYSSGAQTDFTWIRGSISKFAFWNSFLSSYALM